MADPKSCAFACVYSREFHAPKKLLFFCAIVRTMKRAFVLFAALCIALPFVAPQTASPKPKGSERQISGDEAAIRQVSEDWIRFYNAGDPEQALEVVREALSELRRANQTGNIAPSVHRDIKARFDHRMTRLERKSRRPLLDVLGTELQTQE